MINKYKAVVMKYIASAKAQIEQQWTTYANDYGEASVSLYEMNRSVNTVAIILAAKGQKAWILEYGKGEEMADESENPFLAEYLNSSYYNSARNTQGKKILGRPKGNYLDLDDNVHYSNGHLEGIPLEEVGLLKFIDKQIGHPVKPKFIIRNILFGNNGKGLLSEMEAELQQVTIKAVMDAYKLFPRRIVIL